MSGERCVRAWVGVIEGGEGRCAWGSVLRFDPFVRGTRGEALYPNTMQSLFASLIALFETVKRPVPLYIRMIAPFEPMNIPAFLARVKELGWRNSKGEELSSKDLLIRLDELLSEYGSEIEWSWVKSDAVRDSDEIRSINLARESLETISAGKRVINYSKKD